MSKKDQTDNMRGWFDVSRLMGERAEERRQAWMAELGEPAFVHEGLAFWPAEWGVLVIEERANGFHQHEARTYTDDFLDALMRARELPKPTAAPSLGSQQQGDGGL